MDSLESMFGMPMDSIRAKAEDGNVAGLFGMGLYHLITDSLDYPKALRWMGKAADAEFVPAYYFLGMMYLYGVPGPQNITRAETCFRKGLEGGDDSAGFGLGVIMLGRAESQEETDSAVWYIHKAADNEDEKAQSLYAYIRLTGGDGHPADRDEAIRYYYLAAKSGDWVSMKMLTYILCNYTMGEPRLQQAREWALKAKEVEDAAKAARLDPFATDTDDDPADFNPAMEPADTMLVEIDKLIAADNRYRKYGVSFYQFYKMADQERFALDKKMALDGDVSGMEDLGFFYYRGGKGIKKDFTKAKYWLRKAAAAGSDHARQSLEELGW